MNKEELEKMLGIDPGSIDKKLEEYVEEVENLPFPDDGDQVDRARWLGTKISGLVAKLADDTRSQGHKFTQSEVIHGITLALASHVVVFKKDGVGILDIAGTLATGLANEIITMYRDKSSWG